MCNKFVLFDVREGRVSTQDASLYAAANDPTDFARCLISLLDDAALRADMGHLATNAYIGACLGRPKFRQ